MLGEEASEARNKNYKRYRECHSRKHSRLANMEDIFYRVMDTSNPIVSNISLNNRLKKQKRLPFSQDIIRLFLIPKIDGTIHSDSEELLEDCTGFNETISALDEVVLTTE
ncbi:dna-mediated transposase [Lasius niger]|uniref:Dna-mediated transposase n=1 Tax=Lasius niger TaxID=67767 RepID=A0A0J7JZH0_LASNI|nr:dna-mediated transposase [Lasius niger]